MALGRVCSQCALRFDIHVLCDLFAGRYIMEHLPTTATYLMSVYRVAVSHGRRGQCNKQLFAACQDLSWVRFCVSHSYVWFSLAESAMHALLVLGLVVVTAFLHLC